MPLDKNLVKKIAREALCEDAALRDITTQSFIPDDARVEACVVVKEDGVICGVEIACEVFHSFDRALRIRRHKKDGDVVRRGDNIIKIFGKARTVLSCERVALNFLSLLSGISSQTSEAVKKVRARGIQILDTRKTTPGLRVFEKYAVLMGGGRNHRRDLSDQYLVKENHLHVMDRTSGQEVMSWRKKNNLFEIEVQNFSELRAALSYGPDIVMLDNFSVRDIKKAILFLKKIYPDKNKRPLLEISGGIHSGNLSRYALKGVDFISLGALTHSARALDLSLDILRVYSS
jgi:nicotinate-nucleotide pyrophosphorylase (carboxylating)